MARRGENIRKRKDGRWEGRYSYTNEDGTKKIRSVYARTYGEVRAKLVQAKNSRDEWENRKNKKFCNENSIEMIAEEWLCAVKEGYKYSTYIKYRNLYQNHIKECIEKYQKQMPGMEITDEILFGGKTLSNSTKSSVITVFKAIKKYAEEKYQIRNIILKLSNTSVKKKGVEVFNVYEQTRLLRCIYEDMDIYKMGIVLVLSTGLRLGELCALKWSDIHLEMKLLHVNSTVQRISAAENGSKTILMETKPKSRCSKREVPLSDELVSLLSKYKNPSIYVIGGEKPAEPRTYQNMFRKILEQSEIENRNFHVLRHTFATNCISSGADIKSLSEILGHSDVNITLNKYVHPSMELKRQHMNSLSSIYGQYLGQVQ